MQGCAEWGLAETLHARVRENVHNEADEIMWGAPGTLVAARLMLGWTGKSRGGDAWDESADAVLARRDRDGQWTQRLHGHATSYLGTVHGVVGERPGAPRCSSTAARRSLRRATACDPRRAAFVEDGLANWPPAEATSAWRKAR